MSSTAEKVIAALQSYKLKEKGSGQYRCNSPFRSDSDSPSFSLKITGDEEGKYHDFVSEDSGSLYQLAKHLGIEVPTTQPVADTKRVYRGMADYARAHGVEGAVLSKAGWRETTYQGRPALEFPTQTGSRWRFLDGEKPSYKSPQGYKACWYGFKNIGGKIIEGLPLVICNGEVSTVVGQHHGIPAIAVTGGEKAIPDTLLNELKDGVLFVGDENTEIIIALDCDSKGRATAGQIAEQIRALGFNNARAVDLQLGHAGDLADFCMLYQDKALEQLRQRPAMTPEYDGVETPEGVKVYGHGRDWYIMHVSDLEKLPPIEWLVPGEIPKRGITMLYAPPGTGKSFLAADYALRLSQGLSIVYMASEGEYGYRTRVQAWCNHHQKAAGNLYFCMGAVSLMEDPELETFIDSLKPIKPSLIVIDTLADSMLGDENSTRDAGQYMANCKKLYRSLDCALLLVHHTNKGGISERGNIRFRGSADSVLRLIPQDDIFRLESSKLKDAKLFPSRDLALLPVAVTIDGETIESAVVVEAERIVPDAEHLTVNQQTVLEVFGMEVFANGVEVSELVDVTDIGRGSMQRVLSRLLKLGLIHQEGKKSPYSLTPDGDVALTRMTRMTRMTHPDSIKDNSVGGVSQPSQPSQPSLFVNQDTNGHKPNQYEHGK